MIEIVLAAVEFFLIIGASLGLSFLFLRKRLLPSSLDTMILRVILGFAAVIALTFIAGILLFLFSWWLSAMVYCSIFVN